ncbi:SGNH/GDSL hydrolase family protein [Micromonospora sp. WMMD1120]|uniref:SGNH/GDSL hydrolase family protein n=1 Tax=Micromonospora sp. WMMD1120 TaxID=3016106 RepID=UPI0024159BD2|nr:SGNH/GDSL hydrolase family protein [Micromonospora sp. WMMD1120]MDG4807391.1 SGNH/GDSL hydrolase family protein [Micromonospora sp. WMMD1120]
MKPGSGLVGVVAVVLVAVGLSVPSDTPVAAQTTAVACPTPGRPKTKILTVGDSITSGATMTESVTAGYRKELGWLLDQSCVPHEFVVAAVGGVTCNYWSSRMADLVTTHRPDLILINCGTNNNLSNATSAQITAFERTYRALFDTALDLDPDVVMYPSWVQYSSGHGTYGCTTPPGPSPAWLPASEAVVNDAIYRSMSVIDEYGDRVPTWIDYQSIPESYLDQCGVHPTPGGYDVMGRLAYNTIAPRLGVPQVELPCGLVGRRPGKAVGEWTPCDRMNLN